MCGERAPFRPRRDPERVGRLHVEPPRTRVLDERIADRRDTVRDGEDDEAVIVPDQLVSGAQLLQLDGVGEPAEDPPHGVEEIAETGWPVDRDRNLAAAERKGLQHPGQAQVVVGVVMREEDLAQLDQADVRAQQLPLRALGAIEEQALAAATEEHRRGRALRGRHGAGRAEEDEIEVHGPS